METDKNLSQVEVDFVGLLTTLWKTKFIIVLITSAFSISSIIISLSMTEIFDSKATIIPSSSDNTGSSLSSGLSGLGIPSGMLPSSLFGSNNNNSVISIESLSSRVLFRTLYEDEKFLVELFAVDYYDKNSGELVLDKNVYDSSSSKWVNGKPSFEKAYDEFKDYLSINRDVITNVIDVYIFHRSPVVAQRWLSLLIKNTNQFLKGKRLTLLESSSSLISDQLSEQAPRYINNALSSILESNLQQISIMKDNDEYAFSVLDPPNLSEKRVKPYRSRIVIVSTFLGFLISSILVTFLYFLQYEAKLTFIQPKLKFKKF